MVFISFQGFWQQVEKAKVKTKALWRRAERGWKEGLTCFRPISEMASRCVSRFADSAEVNPEDGRLHEDRPLLKHRHSVGFSARKARGAAESTAKRAQSLGNHLAQNGRTASRRLRRRAKDVARNIPTPTRSRRNRRGDDFEPGEDAESRGTFDD